MIILADQHVQLCTEDAAAWRSAMLEHCCDCCGLPQAWTRLVLNVPLLSLFINVNRNEDAWNLPTLWHGGFLWSPPGWRGLPNDGINGDVF